MQDKSKPQGESVPQTLVSNLQALLPAHELEQIAGVQRSTLQRLKDTRMSIARSNQGLEALISALGSGMHSRSQDIAAIRADMDHIHQTLSMVQALLPSSNSSDPSTSASK